MNWNVAKEKIGNLVIGTLRKPVTVGQYLNLVKSFSQDNVNQFANLSEDLNPIHEQGLVHGMLVASMIPTLFAARVPGALYVSQSLQFTGRVVVGAQVRAELLVEIVKDLRSKGILVECKTTIIEVVSGNVVIKGTAKVLLPPETDVV